MAEVGQITYKVSLDTKSLKSGEQEVDKTMDKLKGAASKVGGAMVNVAKAGAVAATGAVVGLGTAAVKSYADYEQLTGGVETLFKDSAGKVMDYAANAYKTAGLSANEYMEQATSFSAKLIKETGGDTAKVADLIDMAITDMSDNANKMGTPIESIRSAYEGLAKGNATMLDNLKLGYGGTQTEMLKLAKDMGVVDKNVKSFNDISFEDAINAIHKVQENLDITGTTAEEAEGTISGSFGMVKSSWENMITAMAGGGDLEETMGQMIDSVKVFGKNLAPVAKQAMSGIVTAIKELTPVVIDALPGILEDLTPAILDVFTSLVDMLPGLIDDLLEFLTKPETLDMLMNGAVKLFMAIVDAVPKIFDSLVAAFWRLFSWLSEKIGAFFADFAGNFGTRISDAFKFAVNGALAMIERFINNPINLMNGMIDGINAALGGIGVNIGHLPTLSLPRMASGGIVEATRGGTPILAGEAGQNEWIIPESKMASVLEQLNGRTDNKQNIVINVSGTFATSTAEQRKVANVIAERLAEVQQSRLMPERSF